MFSPEPALEPPPSLDAGGLTIPDGRLPSHDDVMFLLRSTTVEERKALIEEFAGSFPLYPVRQSTLSQELGELLSPRFSHLCDVTFILSDGSRIDAHQVILASRSAYFDQLIRSARAAKEVPESLLSLCPKLEIFLPDVNEAELRYILHFLYTAVSVQPRGHKRTLDELLRLLRLSCRYSVGDLSDLLELEMQLRIVCDKSFVRSLRLFDELLKQLSVPARDVEASASKHSNENMRLRERLQSLKKYCVNRIATSTRSEDTKGLPAELTELITKYREQKHVPPTFRFNTLDLYTQEAILRRCLGFSFEPRRGYADCACLVAGQPVEAHRCILAARSGFFEGAFSPSAFQEARTGSIHIRNFSSPAAFSAFLRFLYTDELNVLEADDILLELLCKCDFYALRSDRLKQLCVERLNLLPKVVPAPAWKMTSNDAMLQEAVKNGLCTFSVTGHFFIYQSFWHCLDCHLIDNLGCCQVCQVKCHAGHRIVYGGEGAFFCDCGNRSVGCRALPQKRV